jgi:hypothetical protein
MIVLALTAVTRGRRPSPIKMATIPQVVDTDRLKWSFQCFFGTGQSVMDVSVATVGRVEQTMDVVGWTEPPILKLLRCKGSLWRF